MNIAPYMNIVPYTHTEHYELVKEWLASKDITVPRKELFYEFGVVVGNIVIGFLTKTAPGQAMIDHLVGDPNAPAEERDRAVRLLGKILEEKAKKEGAKQIIAMAKLPAMKIRMEEEGWKPVGEYTLYAKPLEEGVS